MLCKYAIYSAGQARHCNDPRARASRILLTEPLTLAGFGAASVTFGRRHSQLERGAAQNAHTLGT